MALRMPCRKGTLQTFLDQWTDPEWLGRHFDPEEADLVSAAVRDCRRNLRKAGPDSAPVGVIRLEGVLTLYVLARRTGLAALRGGLPGADAEEAPAADGDDVGKAQERLRKALKEFEDFAPNAAQTGTPAGLADLLRPLLKDTGDVLPEAIGANEAHGNGARKRNGDSPVPHSNAFERDEN